MPTAATLAPLVNAYTIREGASRMIVVPNASAFATTQVVTVTGTLLKKQVVALAPMTGRRRVSLGENGGAYRIEADGDLHFCVGGLPLQPHIICELQNASAWLSTFQGAIGQPISVTGFFRCMFEHPGFDPQDDAHIFEIHPVRGVAVGGRTLAVNVDIPDPRSIHTWTSPHPLNDQDGRIRVTYEKGTDTWTFTNMDGKDENYVRVAGKITNIHRNVTGGAPATFTLTSPEIGHPIQTLCLPDTTAARQLALLTSSSVTMIALRNIDLRQGLANRYVINLLAIDIQPGG